MKKKRTDPGHVTLSQLRQGGRAPCLGIFWLAEGALLIDKAPLSEAEPYGNRLTHRRSHIDVWEEWQRTGKAPAEVPYEQEPRGRVVFDATAETFVILADSCILKGKGLIARIKLELRLPKGTEIGSDSHYRCLKCLRRSADDDE